MNQLCSVTTDITGTVVTYNRGGGFCQQFAPEWVNLEVVLNTQIRNPLRIKSIDSIRQLTLFAPLTDSAGNPVAFNSPVPLSPNRETIYQAMMNTVAKVPGVLTTSRRPPKGTNVDPGMQPAIFLEQIGENPMSARGLPYKWELDVMLCIYAWAPDESTAPATFLNPILDGIEALFPGQSVLGSTPNRLGGLVDEIRLFGDGKAFAGSIGNQATAHVPVRIVTI